MNDIIKTRLLFCCSLVFSLWASSCRSDKKQEIVLGWEDKQVKKIHIPLDMFPQTIDQNSLLQVRVTLEKQVSPGILGDYSIDKEYVTFKPYIPFTKGLKYQVLFRESKLTEIRIPPPEGKKMPLVKDIYPHEDSLPENLLKIYIVFSEAMREGVSAQYVALVKNGKDTLKDVFLDLQPELWNQDRSILTLWINPGRVKRDLIPNQELGAPIQAGNQYQIVIKPGWQDGLGDTVATAFTKNFYAVDRDTKSPSLDDWYVVAPKAGARNSLNIHLHESLDHQVLLKALTILDSDAKEVQGTVEITGDERVWRFVPITGWKKGKYEIKVMPIIEDLAGNNLDRLFDTDVLEASKKDGYNITIRPVYAKYFHVR